MGERARTRVVGVRLADDQYAALVRLAEQNGKTPTTFAYELLRERMEELDGEG